MVQRPPVAPHFRVLPPAPFLPLDAEALEEVTEAPLPIEFTLPPPPATLFSFFFLALTLPPPPAAPTTPSAGPPSEEAGEEAPESSSTAPGVITPPLRVEGVLMEAREEEVAPKPESRVSL